MRGKRIWFVATRSLVTMRYGGSHVWAISESEATNKVEEAMGDAILYAYSVPPSASILEEADAFDRANGPYENRSE